MKKISFREPDNDKWRRWVRDCRATTQQICDAFQRGETPTVTPLYSRRKDIFCDSAGGFQGKCGYCERYVLSDYGELDHFRPKRTPCDASRSKVKKLEDGVEKTHPGYYWLWYDWTNLILSCGRCNNEKREIFPVFRSRAWLPGEENTEVPKLVNPLVDDVSKHIGFNRETGELEAKTKKGLATIELLRLNERNLPRQRRNIYVNTGILFDRIFDDGGLNARQRFEKLYAAADESFASVVQLAFRERRRTRLRRRRAS